MHRGSFIAVLATLVALLGAIGNAEAANRCPKHSLAPITCATVSVPLDHSGAVPGSIDLQVRWVREARRAREAIVVLAGGPGQAATPFLEDSSLVLAQELATRDLVVFDQRGTGGSGAIRCAGFQAAAYRSQLAKSSAQCAAQLGSSRSFYTTADSVADIELVRDRLGYDRLTILGTSYGTKVALDYAIRFPEHVSRLVLDSVVLPEGPDPYSRSTVAAIPRVLGGICAREACKGITGDVVNDFRTLAERVRKTALRGKAIGLDGRPRHVAIGRASLLGMLLEGDLDPASRAALPAAFRSAVQGNSALLLRLVERSQHPRFRPGNASLDSEGLYTATTCEEGPLPWAPDTPAGSRLSYAISQPSVTDAELAPFDREGVIAASGLEACELWPTAGAASPKPAKPLPEVPTLILAGTDDLRTPLEDATVLAQRLPAGKLVAVRHSGHDVLGSDLSGCAERALKSFFADRLASHVCGHRLDFLQGLFKPVPLPPTTLSDLDPAPGSAGDRGKTVTAVNDTVGDAFHFMLLDIFSSSGDPDGKAIRIPGLRGGRMVLSKRGLRFQRLSYVPGIQINSTASAEQFRRSLRRGSTFILRVRVSGSAGIAGTLRIPMAAGRLITGTLGGEPVRAGQRRPDLGMRGRLALRQLLAGAPRHLLPDARQREEQRK